MSSKIHNTWVQIMAFNALTLYCHGVADLESCLALTMVFLSAFRKTFNFHPGRSLSQLPCGALFLSAFCLCAGGVRAGNYLFTVSERSINCRLNLPFPSQSSLLHCLNCLTCVSFSACVSFCTKKMSLKKKEKSDHLQISTYSLCGWQHKREKHVGSKMSA